MMILVVVLLILGFICMLGKGGILIAGYNTASKDTNAKYDIVKLNHCFAILCFGIAIILDFSIYFGDNFATYIAFSIVIVRIVIALVVSNTYCKDK